MNLLAIIAAAAITPFAGVDEAPDWPGGGAAPSAAVQISDPPPEADPPPAADSTLAAGAERSADAAAPARHGADEDSAREERPALVEPPSNLEADADSELAAAAEDAASNADIDADADASARALEPQPRDPAADKETAAAVFDYIESLRTLRGRFVQIDPYGGVSEGTFYLRRPGRIRFEYDPPNPNLIVADGAWVIVQDRDLETTDRIPIGQTPLKYLLRSEVDRDDLEIVAVEREAGALALSLASTDSETEGVLTLVFSEPQLELRQWSVTDPQGQVTTIALRDVVKGVRIDSRLFDLNEDEF